MLIPLAISMLLAIVMSVDGAHIVHNQLSLDGWLSVLTSTQVWLSILFSIAIAVVSGFVSNSIAFAIIQRRYKVVQTIHWYAVLPLAIPSVGIATVMFMMYASSGIVARVLYAVGVSEQVLGEISPITDTFGIGIILCNVLLVTPIIVYVLHSIAHAQDVWAVHQTAKQLGATDKQAWQKVVKPLLRKQILPTVFLYAIVSFGAYEVPTIVGSQNPRMVSVVLLDKLRRFDLANIPQAYVLAVLVVVVSILGVYISESILSKNATKEQ